MIAGRLGEYVANENQRVLPDEAIHGAKRCLVDWFATTVPGGVQNPAPMLTAALADEMSNSAHAELIPGGGTTGARTAALINAAAAHTVEFDDIWRDGLYHPGAPVIAAALAVAQVEDVDGSAFLRAMTIGYEVSNRLAVAINPAHYRYWHTTATVGHHGAAAAACAALGLDAVQTAHALGNVTSFAAGLQQAFRSDSMTKPFHVGQAAANGVLAALSAREGVTSSDGMLEGEVGFVNAMSDGASLESMFDDLGSFYTVAHVTQKNHGCCGHTFAAIDAALALRAENGFSFKDIKAVRVHSYAAAKNICGNSVPTTAAEARFSLPYVIAAAMRFGSVRLVAFEPENIADPEMLDFASRVDVIVDAGLEAKFPLARSATVEIDLHNGQTFERHCPTRKGDPENPLTDAEINDKYDELVTPVVGEPAGQLRNALWAIDSLSSMRGLMAHHIDSPIAVATRG